MTKPKNKRIMRNFKINEISAVDKPAQEGAVASIMKRNEEIQKRSALTNAVEGHAHTLTIYSDGAYRTVGHTSYAEGTNNSGGHYHPWIMNENGEIIIGVADGHTHIIDVMSKADDLGGPAGNPPNKEKKAGAPSAIAGDTIEKQKENLSMTEEQIRELKEQLAKAKAVLAMSAETRGYYNELSEPAKDAFMAKSVSEQNAEAAAAIAKAANMKEVVYKSSTGVEYTKADDARLVQLAKDNDELMKGIREERAKALEAEIAKQASELEHLPGSQEARVALLKSVQAIEDEKVREEALRALKSKNADSEPAFKMAGVVAKTNGDSSGADLDKKAKEYAKANNVSFAKAMDAILRTPEGRALYSKSV